MLILGAILGSVFGSRSTKREPGIRIRTLVNIRGNVLCCSGKFSHSRDVISSFKVDFGLRLQNSVSELFVLNLEKPYFILF